MENIAFDTTRPASSTNIVEKDLGDVAVKLNEMINKCKLMEQGKSFVFQQEMEDFKQLLHRFKTMKNKTMEWNKISGPSESMLTNYKNIETCPTDRMKDLLNELCIIKLNGGLGTTMGCTGPKSVIKVTDDATFLDLTVQQIMYLNETFGVNVPLILMNSFNTDEDTEKVISKYRNLPIRILMFNQSKFPRIEKDTLLPLAAQHDSPKDDWTPPGHGDLYRSFARSGLLNEMLEEGKKFVFVSNIDNLGATVDLSVLNWMTKENVDYAMEVTAKTRADVKGGTLISYDGKLKLFEIAQCPADKVDEFKSINKFKIFNTNNIWINLHSMKTFVEEGLCNELDVIVNPKKVKGKDIIQLETAVGAAIDYFPNARGIEVSRSRFLPVKGCSDLLLVQSNLYEPLNGNLTLSKKRTFPELPIIKLGETFKTVGEYQSRCKSIPNLIELDSLTVSGNVYFGNNVTLRGNVIIIAPPGSRIDIPDNTVLENKIVTVEVLSSGSMKILDQ